MGWPWSGFGRKGVEKALWWGQSADLEGVSEMAGTVVSVLEAVIDARERAFLRAVDMVFLVLNGSLSRG